MSSRLIRAVCSIALSLCAPLAAAQADFPSKPIRLMVGFPPGGSTDVLSRAAALEARKLLGQEILIVNRPGASGTIAISEVAASNADGYTLGVTASSATTLAHHFVSVRPDLLEATTALLVLGKQRLGLVTNGDSQQRSFKDFIEYARKNPGKVSIGVPGPGTKTELISRALGMYEKVDLSVVPFQGDAAVATGIRGGHITAGSFSAGGWATQVRAGTLRLIASYEEERFEGAPDVPTLTEMGFKLTSASVQYLFGPKGVPPAVVKRLTAAFAEAVRTPAYVRIATEAGLHDANPLSGEALAGFLLKDRTANTELVEKLGMKKKP